MGITAPLNFPEAVVTAGGADEGTAIPNSQRSYSRSRLDEVQSLEPAGPEGGKRGGRVLEGRRTCRA